MTRKYTSLPYIEKPVAEGNFSRTGRKPITQIIIHSTVSTAQSAIAWFNNPKAKVSAHYIIDNNGQLYAMLEEYYVAYHAGNWDVNCSSIGIEHEWYKNLTPSDRLYQTSARLVADICKFYGLGCNRGVIKGHKEIVATSCPNAIDVDRIVREAQAILNPPQSKPTYQELEQKVKDLLATEERLKREKDEIIRQYEERIRKIQEQNNILLAETRAKVLNELKQKIISLLNSLS